jgi:hypothetical protein
LALWVLALWVLALWVLALWVLALWVLALWVCPQALERYSTWAQRARGSRLIKLRFRSIAIASNVASLGYSGHYQINFSPEDSAQFVINFRPKTSAQFI